MALTQTNHMDIQCSYFSLTSLAFFAKIYFKRKELTGPPSPPKKKIKELASEDPLPMAAEK